MSEFGVRTRWRALLANPLLRRAVRRSRRPWYRPSWWPGRRPFHLLLAAMAAAAVGGGLASLGWAVEDDLTSVTHNWFTVLIVLFGFGLPWVAPAYAVPAIAGEREAGRLDLLRVTLLGEDGTVLGKVLEVLVRLWLVVLALVVLTGLQAPWHIWSKVVLPDHVLPMRLEPGKELVWALSGALLPWSHLAVNSAAGLFASVHLRSLGAALGAVYAVLFVWRMILRLFVFIGVDVLDWELGSTWALPLVEAASEMAASSVLVWGTVWRLGRD